LQEIRHSALMHKTPLHDEHVRLGAKMVWFAGWDMPIQYTTIIDEHMAVREHSGAFDVSHMGDFLIKGTGAGDLVNTLCTNDVQGAPVGRCVYAHILDDQGRILDDTIVTVLGQDEYLMVPNAATTERMRKWVTGHIHGQEFHDMSTDLACIAVQGPTAKGVVAQLTTADLSSMKSFWASFVNLDRLGTRRSAQTTPLLSWRKTINEDTHGIVAFVSRTGYTGEDGFEIVVENADAVSVWDAVIGKGMQFGLKPIGLGARDTLRLEKSLLLSGTDFDGSQTSLQTGPGWVVDWGHDFVGKQALVQQKAVGNYDKLVNIIAKDKGIPRHGYEILKDGAKVGAVTSGTLSPVLKQGIAMGYVPLALAKAGTAVQIKIRDNVINAEIVKPPFVKRD
jgi:aminomethyltransferase